MSKAKRKKRDVDDLEIQALNELRNIAWDIESPDIMKMYEAANRLASHPMNRILLPKIMSLLRVEDANLRHSFFTVAAMNVHGQYVDELFSWMDVLNPSERSQVLDAVKEHLKTDDVPTSVAEQKRWISALEGLGREHEPAVFDIMALLNSPGITWVRKRLRENLEFLSLGAVQKLTMFPENQRTKLIELICKESANRRRDLLPYICGIVDRKTTRYLLHFFKNSTWQERVEIAAAISSLGIASTRGMIMALVADPNWQVKQAIMENVNIQESKFSSIVRILDYFLADSHYRIRSSAERLLLRLGSEACSNTPIQKQRDKLERKFRDQLLKAAQAHQDIDTKWLGIEISKPDIMVDLLEKVTTEHDFDAQKPEGVSLSDISPIGIEKKEVPQEDVGKKSLLSALLGAKQESSTSDKTETLHVEETPATDLSIPATSMILLHLAKLSSTIGKEVPIEELKKSATSTGITEKEFKAALSALEKEGSIYKPSKKTISSVEYRSADD